MEIGFITSDRLAEPAVPVTGDPMLVCALVGETNMGMCAFWTGQNGRCHKRELEGGIGLFGPVTKATDE